MSASSISTTPGTIALTREPALSEKYRVKTAAAAGPTMARTCKNTRASVTPQASAIAKPTVANAKPSKASAMRGRLFSHDSCSTT